MKEQPQIILKTGIHKEKRIVQINFKKNDEILNLLRTIEGLRWSKTMSCWYAPYTDKIRQELFQILNGKAWIDYSALNEKPGDEKSSDKKKTSRSLIVPHNELSVLGEEAEKKIAEFKNWLRSKRYSESTIGTYIDSLNTFLRYFAHKSISEITNTDIILFNNNYILAKKLSSSFQNQVVNAIKLFFRTIVSKKLDPELIHRPKRAHVLPNVLSKEEVKLILNAHKNIKHKAMLSLIYSCGLRRSELLNLKLDNIDSKRGLIIIKKAKGKKDRIAPLSDKILHLLRDYFTACKPKEWLFEGQNGVGQYDERSLAKVLKQALDKSKISKPVSLHWLRHSYATHLLENGTDLRYIQEILGHSRSRTTEIYTHVSNKSIQKIVSPFDTL